MGLLDELKKYFALKGETLGKTEIVSLVREESSVPIALKPTDPAPTVKGVYEPTVDGTYANAGGLKRETGVGGADEGKYVKFFFDGVEWEKNSVPLPVLNIESDISSNLFQAATDVIPDGLILIGDGKPGTSGGNAEGAYTKPIRIQGNSELEIRKGLNPIPNYVFFYTEEDIYIGEVAAPGQISRVLSPPNASIIRGNVSSTKAKRDADIAAFGIYEIGVKKIEGKPLEANSLTRGNRVPEPNSQSGAVSKGYMEEKTVLKAAVKFQPVANLIDPAKVVNNSYIWSDGVIDGGSPNKNSYARTEPIPLDITKTHLSFRRKSTLNVFGAFLDENMSHVPANLSVGSALTGTFAQPPAARFIVQNLSNDPATRADDIKNSLLVYGTQIPAEYVNELANKKVFDPLSEKYVLHPFFGKRYIANGHSIPDGIGAGGRTFCYPTLISKKLSMTLVGNYAISGSTLAEKAGFPNEKNPLVNRIEAMSSDADLVTIDIGTNDFNYSFTPFGTMESRDKNTFYGALHLACQQLQAKYTAKKIIWLTPIKRAQIENPLPESVNAVGKRLQDYADAIIEVCSYYGIDTYDNFRNCRLNPHLPQYATYFDTVKTHPLANGHVIMANDLINYLSSVSP